MKGEQPGKQYDDDDGASTGFPPDGSISLSHSCPGVPCSQGNIMILISKALFTMGTERCFSYTSGDAAS